MLSNISAHAEPIKCLMNGVWLKELKMHRDDRGSVTELFRDSWKFGADLAQWNLVSTNAGVVRGVHVHTKRHDYMCVLYGKAGIGLCDIRPQSSSYQARLLVEMSADSLSVLTIPPGVIHGFYSHTDSILTCAFSEEWDLSDDFGCYWADPKLNIPWPSLSARCSDKDEVQPSFERLIDSLAQSAAS